MLAIVIVNWNGWKDTLLCLESVFQLNSTAPFCVIVCDNQSRDGSPEMIENWARGESNVKKTELASSPVPLEITPKPVVFLRMSRAESESGDYRFAPLTLIETGGNLGFAGGNNVGIRYGLKNSSITDFWLLNHDTVVHPEALSALLARQNTFEKPGMIGSTLLYFDEPEKIQAQGGARLDKETFTATHLGVNLRSESALEPKLVEAEMDYVVGASMLVSRDFIEEIGLMEESYFLYFEELDWALRSKGKFRLGYAPDSFVFHKEGAKIGSSHRGNESPLSFYLLNLNRLRLVRRFWKEKVPQLKKRMLWEMLIFAKRRQFYKVRLLIYILTGRQPPDFEIPVLDSKI